MNDNPLPSWRDTGTRRAIIDFTESLAGVPPEERIAVFDNDGTLWCEKPMPIQLDYTAGRRRALERARTQCWTVISVRDDWEEVFGGS